MSLAVFVARIGENINSYKFSVGKWEEKRPLGKPRRRWQCNIEIYL